MHSGCNDTPNRRRILPNADGVIGRIGVGFSVLVLFWTVLFLLWKAWNQFGFWAILVPAILVVSYGIGCLIMDE